MSDSYFRTRFSFDIRRKAVWKEIAGYLQRFIPEDGAVLDLGAGYCDFINQIRAAERYALDANDSLIKYVGAGVKAVTGRVEETLSRFKDGSVSTVFSSNFLEHLDWPEIEKVTLQVRRILTGKGRWIIIQPNFKYSCRDYFDDYTHRTIFTEISLSDYLISKGFLPERKVPRFLPFSFHNRLPKSPFLVRLYLRSPFKVLARQMLIIVRKEEDVAK